MWNTGFPIDVAQQGRGDSAEMIDGLKPPTLDIWQNRMMMIRQLLIGGWSGNAAGGLNGWIIFGLHYRALLPRFGVAVVFFGLFAGFDSLFAWLGFPWLGWSYAKSFALLAIAGYASLLSLRLVVGIAEFEGFGRIVAGMWLPIAVMGLATYLLFFNDQGQELGLGLMDANVNWVQTDALCLVLIYWALSAWLSARIGLSRAFPQLEQHQVVLFWGPRLVGVLAHLIAACSLSSAALKDTKFTNTVPNVLLAFAVPSAIVLAILFAWFLDHAVLSHRSSVGQRARAHWKMWVAVGLGVVLFICLRWWQEDIPTGLFPGTLAISLSAIIFLSLISWIRRGAPFGHGVHQEHLRLDAHAEARISWKWGWGLAAIMFAGTALVWITPTGVGHLFGSLIIAFFAFGSFLVGANLLDLTADSLARHCKRRGFTAVHRRAVWCAFIGLLVMPATLMSFRNYHRVRLCEPCTSAPVPAGAQWAAIERYNKRPTVTEAAQAWYRQAEPIYHALHPGQPVPLFIIATAGGGIRAAYWTATVLEELEKQLDAEAIKGQNASVGNTPAADGLMRHLLFAISGVSGGSVGSAAYIAAVHDHVMNGRPVQPTSYLKADLLAPGLASLAFIDIPSNFLPDFGQIDRGEALERGLERVRTTKDDPDGLLSHSFLSFFPQIGSSQNSLPWRPALLLNATHLGTGRRIITSNLHIDPATFVDSYDALDILKSDVRLSTAAHNSARFTYVSPAGNLVPAASPGISYGFVVDGGYFENYGAQTAVELARKAIEAIGGAKIRPVILQISSDPTMVENKTLVRQRCAGNGGESLEPPRSGRILSLFNELSAPLIGIMSVRGAHGFAAITSLARLCCEDSSAARRREQQARNSISDIRDEAASAAAQRVFVHLAMCEAATEEHINPPLGWVLSEATRKKFKDILQKCDNGKELATLKEALGGTFSEPKQTAGNSNPKPSRS
jgi:hypothetical protein